MKHPWITAPMSAVLLLAGCHRPSEPAPASVPGPPAAVQVRRVEQRDHPAFEEVVGTVRPVLRSTLEAKVSGRIERMLVVPGQAVKAGELLAELHVQEIRSRLDQAAAQAEQAERDLKRYAALVEKNAVTLQEYDAVVARERTARAARVEAETMLGYARVVAPFDGVIVRKLADVGDLAAPGRSLLELEDPGRLRLEADVPESFIGRLSQGQRLVAGFGTPVVSTECTVSEIAPVSDPASRTFLVKLDLPPGAGVRAGQFGRLAVPLAAAPGIRIPAPALVVRGQMEMVFTAEKGVARMRLVRSGRRSGGEVEILSGLSAGETVVMSGADGLLDGRPLEVRP